MLATYMQRMCNNNLALVVQKLDITTQGISVRETNCAIQWIVIYPVDSIIHVLNNWDLEIRIVGSSCHPQLYLLAI